MGTNFYKKIIKKKPTKDGRVLVREVHICKRSGGWKIIFDHNWGLYYKPTRDSLNKFLRTPGSIVDEYGSSYSVEEFWDMVDDWNNLASNKWTSESFEEHQKQIYPNHYIIDNSRDCFRCKEEFDLDTIPKYYDFFAPDNSGLVFSTSTDFC